MNTLTLGSVEIPLTADANGLVGTAVIDGEPVAIHVTVTPRGRRTATPAKARLDRAGRDAGARFTASL